MVETVAKDTLPAPVVETEAQDGEVIDVAEARAKFLKQGEALVRKNIDKYETSRTTVVRSLYLINITGVWRIHREVGNPKKGRYTNFKDYVRGEFPTFQQTPERLYQLFKDIKETAEIREAVTGLIEEGVVDATVLDKNDGRTREAKKQTALRQARVTEKQIRNAWEAFANRMQNTEDDASKERLQAILDDHHSAIVALLGDLVTFIEDEETDAGEEGESAETQESANLVGEPA